MMSRIRCYVPICEQPAIWRLSGVDWEGTDGHGNLNYTRKITRHVCGVHLSSIAGSMTGRLGLAVTQSSIGQAGPARPVQGSLL